MQRRLTIALVGVALMSILLVGLGVVAFAGVGARAQATNSVVLQLEALQELSGQSVDIATLEPAIRRLGDAFGDGTVGVGWISDDGRLEAFSGRGPERREPSGIELDDDELELFATGVPVIVDRRNSVIGLLRTDASGTRFARDRDGSAVLWVEQRVGNVPPQARTWFLLSAIGVVLAAALVAAWLARRFTEPLRNIERATATIAAGRLDTRIEVTSNDELGQLAGSVNRMAADLQHSRAAEQQFLLSITHDLRTPLTAIAGYGEALRDGAVDDPVRAGEIIGSNADRLNRLVGDLLTLARLEGNAFDFAHAVVDPSALAAEVVDGAAQRAEEYDLVVELVGDVSALRIDVDPDRLIQVMNNLVDNALKFAARRVEVGVRAIDGQAVISVTDDGPGIPEADLPFVFERLYVTQLRPVRAESSSGLGLAIVRELTEGMGGRVTAARGPSGGTTMSLSFPLR